MSANYAGALSSRECNKAVDPLRSDLSCSRGQKPDHGGASRSSVIAKRSQLEERTPEKPLNGIAE
jgi:hypothetical protein